MIKLLDGKDNTVKVSVQFLKKYYGVYAEIALNGKEYETSCVKGDEARFVIPKEDVAEICKREKCEAILRFFDASDIQIAESRETFTVAPDARSAFGSNLMNITIGSIG